MIFRSAALALTLATGLVAQPANAVIWADLTTIVNPLGADADPSDGVSGNFGALGVDVTYSGDVVGAQVNGLGTNYWSIYPSATKPDTTDIIRIRFGGVKTITFSQSVTDVYLALVSWNNQVVDFSHQFTIASQGFGYFGTGFIIANPGNLRTRLNTTGVTNEFHGTLKFAGPITTLTFDDNAENWHGFQIGIGSVTPVVVPPPSGVPEPTTWLTMLMGFGLLGAAMRRTRSLRATSLA